MAQAAGMAVGSVPQASPQRLGALLLHGFTGGPDTLGPLAAALRSLELPVAVPVLRGHGGPTPEALRGVRWPDWVADGTRALEQLRRTSERVVVVGHSMGSLVALHLAADHPEAVDSLILSAPALQLASPLAPGGPLQLLTPVVRRLLRRWPIPKSYADPTQLPCDTSYPWAPMDALASFLNFSTLTRRRLPEVQAPALILQSRADPVVTAGNVALLQAALATPPSQQRVVWFERSRHELFRDCEGAAAVRTVVAFVQERLRLAELGATDTERCLP